MSEYKPGVSGAVDRLAPLLDRALEMAKRAGQDVPRDCDLHMLENIIHTAAGGLEFTLREKQYWEMVEDGEIVHPDPPRENRSSPPIPRECLARWRRDLKMGVDATHARAVADRLLREVDRLKDQMAYLKLKEESRIGMEKHKTLERLKEIHLG